ncbi:hypothetical protein FB45DRAFT_1022237 [Roridomyces roridus]|uniref:Uncharacterized protein n=1 Tax=Roridomyces roridus TaxID=1738132 RepID=A0AAD7FSX6_9AGAR|nr:hypothetical protein FB45DRAFT_1022237 [Roridomyces roridus]
MPLLSEIPFRGLRLSDKHKQVDITYKLPVAVFKRLVLKETDLRASFVVLPTSPSLADHVTDFSTWRPEGMNIPPVRSWTSEAPSVIDRALDSFGISMPLLEFHEVQSMCPNQRLSMQSGEDADDEDEELEDVRRSFLSSAALASDMTKNPLNAVKRAPYVITRTQIRAVDETHIFNRKAFNKEHNRLKSSSCGQDMAATPDPNLCHKLYMRNGNWETRLELRIPDEDTSQFHTEFVYGPYIGHGRFSAGPKDIVRLPVTREKCPESENTPLDDPEFIEINWQLSFTGRSPAKFSSTEIYPRPHRVPHNASAYKMAKAHDSAERWNGLYGHRFYEDAHPRRRVLIGVLETVFSFILVVLDMGYWYTRITTTSISIPGTLLIALSGAMSGLTYIANTIENDKLGLSMTRWAGWLWLIVWSLIAKFYLPFLMLNAVTRLQVDWRGWIPTVRRIGATHQERNSQRLDSRTGLVFQLGVSPPLALDYSSIRIISQLCIPLTALFYLLSPDDNYHILSSSMPSPSPEDLPTNIIFHIHRVISFPLLFTGTTSQLLLNHRTRTFAGGYKAAVLVRFILLALTLVVHSVAVVGRFDARPGFSIPQALDTMLLGIMGYQAATLPKAVQKVDDEDTE